MLPSASALASRREERVQKAFSVDHHGPGDARLSHSAAGIYGESGDYVARNQPAQPPAGGRLPPFDHKTGEGHVPFHGGDYHDARYKKRNQVVPLIVEALGGIGRRGARCLRFLARRASCRKRGRDGTTYSRFHPSNYLSHHLAGIVTAAVFSDAAHIVEEIALLKTRTSGATRTAAAANPIE